jgi:hypothetical protein
MATSPVDEAAVDAVIAELQRQQAGGRAAILPADSQSLGSITSGVTKSIGAEALMGQENKQNWSEFSGWQDPSRSLNPQYRQAMLAKNFYEAGYEGKCPYKDMGHMLSELYRSKVNGTREEFTRRHADSYKGLTDRGFFKARGMTGNVGEDGGYLLQPEIAPTIETLFVQNDLASRVKTIPTTATTYKVPRLKDLDRNDGTRHGGVQHYWIDEGDPGRESRPKFAITTLEMRKLAVFVYITEEMMNSDYFRWLYTALTRATERVYLVNFSDEYFC